MAAKRNPVARDLRTPKYAKRVVRPKKGKGAYQRNRRPDIRRDGGSALWGAPGIP